MLLMRKLSSSQFGGASRPWDSILGKGDSADLMHSNNWMFYSEAVLPVSIRVHLLLNECMTI